LLDLITKFEHTGSLSERDVLSGVVAFVDLAPAKDLESVVIDPNSDAELRNRLQESSTALGASENFFEDLRQWVHTNMGGEATTTTECATHLAELQTELGLRIPLGRIQWGLPRHKALLCKVVLDNLKIPSRLNRAVAHDGSVLYWNLMLGGGPKQDKRKVTEILWSELPSDHSLVDKSFSLTTPASLKDYKLSPSQVGSFGFVMDAAPKKAMGIPEPLIIKAVKLDMEVNQIMKEGRMQW